MDKPGQGMGDDGHGESNDHAGHQDKRMSETGAGKNDSGFLPFKMNEEDLVDGYTSTRKRSRCWVVSNGRPGTQNQALGLARALERRLAMSVHVKQVVTNSSLRARAFGFNSDPFKKLTSSGHLLRPPYPDLWIATGRDIVALTTGIKKRSPETFTIQTQNPRVPLHNFDLVVPPEHDLLKGDNVLSMIGSPTPLTPEKITSMRAAHADWFADIPTPQIAVLIGGNNKTKWMTTEILDRLCHQLIALVDKGYGVIITSSRRTDANHLAILRENLKVALRAGTIKLFEASDAQVTGFNPYPAMLSDAAAILVTEDSVNMISEAALTGLPVYTIPLKGKYGKFGHFHKSMRRREVTRTFTGKIARWSYDPLNETERVAEEIANRLILTGNFDRLDR